MVESGEIKSTIAESAGQVPTSTNGTGGQHMPPRAFTDIGNGERLVDLFGDRIRYCHGWRSWLIWSGTRWMMDTTKEIEHLAKQVVRSIYREAETFTDETQRKRCASWAITSEKNELKTTPP